ncbi:hypothetical protein GQ54DRAFT_23843 [Martensiomyces pterosporus]|nr:hypothetical protein GQ54DRAFT_23843 [Martensiomyces pterosporus]
MSPPCAACLVFMTQPLAAKKRLGVEQKSSIAGASELPPALLLDKSSMYAAMGCWRSPLARYAGSCHQSRVMCARHRHQCCTLDSLAGYRRQKKTCCW